MIITLNSFLGRLFVSTSFSSSGALSCFFIWNIFLWPLYLTWCFYVCVSYLLVAYILFFLYIDQISDQYPFYYLWRSFFLTSYKACLPVINYLDFLSSEKLFLPSSLFKDSFTGYDILDWYCSFCTLNVLLCYLFACMVFEKKLDEISSLFIYS